MPRLQLTFSIVSFSLLVASTAIQAQTSSISRNSPFAATAATGPAPVLELATYDVVGVMSLGKEKLIAIADRQARKEYWIPIGRAVGGIEIISYEPRTEEIIARIHGELRTLRLRNAADPGHATTNTAVATAMPGPVASAQPTAPAAPVPSGPPPALKPLTTQEEQEREARMLVSDLMEISLQQRKAYEEAQRKKTPPLPVPVNTPAPKMNR